MTSRLAVMRSQVRRVLFRTRAWRRLFADPTGKQPLSDDATIVLGQLKRFARWGKNPRVADRNGQTDLFETGRMVGRQEAVQLVVESLHLDERVFINMQEVIPDE